MKKILFLMFVLVAYGITEDYSFMKCDVYEYFKESNYYHQKYKDVENFDLKKDKELFYKIYKDKDLLKLLAEIGISKVNNLECPDISNTILAKMNKQVERVIEFVWVNVWFDRTLTSKDFFLKAINMMSFNERFNVLERLFYNRESFYKNEKLYQYAKNNCDFLIKNLNDISIANVIKTKQHYNNFTSNTLIIINYLRIISFLQDDDCLFYFRRIIGGLLYYSESLEMQNFLLIELKNDVDKIQTFKPEVKEKILLLIDESMYKTS